MKVETKENQIILKEVYNSITLETREGKQLHICMRDMGFEMKIDDGEWHLLTDESDFLIKPIGWEANIAMAFKDAFDFSGYKHDNEVVHEVANKAAANFLDQLISKDVENDQTQNKYVDESTTEKENPLNKQN